MQLISDRKLISFAAHDIRTMHTISESAHRAYINLIKTLSDASPYDDRTTMQRMISRTSIKHVRYDCCRNSCFCYAKDDSLTKCPNPKCGLDRWKPGSKVPYKTYDHIPLIPRLRLQYADPNRARMFTTYRQSAETANSSANLTTDFWNSRLFRSQKQKKNLYQNPTDLAFFMSTDGVRVFKTRTNYIIWPIILINLNLPPHERYLKENIILIGIIPGPKQPVDLDSFFYPLCMEMLKLQEGIPAWNGLLDQEFILRAHISLIGADQVGREKLMNMKGSGSYKFCSYCQISGYSSRISGKRGGRVYSPFQPPKDTPNNARHHLVDPEINFKPLPYYTNDPEYKMRRDSKFRYHAEHVTYHMDDDHSTDTGIKGTNVLHTLQSIDFPRSFVIDIMHLFFQNLIPLLFDHFRGKFFKSDKTEASHTAPETQANIPPASARFVQTDDPYCVPPPEWTRLGKDMRASASSVPADFGAQVRDISENFATFKAVEWQNWAYIFSPILLRDIFPADIYQAYVSLISTLQIISEQTIDKSQDQMQSLRCRIANFLEHYEKTYYRYEFKRLPACRTTLHYLAHLPDVIDWAGPPCNYWQFPMERYCGMIISTVRSHALDALYIIDSSY